MSSLFVDEDMDTDVVGNNDSEVPLVSSVEEAILITSKYFHGSLIEGRGEK